MPANPSDTVLLQPDGSNFNARIVGDEWNNRLETVDGFTIERDDDDTWRHVLRFEGTKAVLAPTRADEEPLSGIQHNVHKTLSPVPSDAVGVLRLPDLSGPAEPGLDGTNAVPIGSFNGPILLILAEFSNQPGINPEWFWGNITVPPVIDYFQKASYGKVNLTRANETHGVNNNGVIGWVNLGYPHPNTGSNTSTTNQQITKDAIIAADPYIDYASYDTNGDNIIDSDELAVVVVVAGYDYAYSPNYSPAVWAHKWSLSDIGAPTVDGVLVGDFNNGNGGYAQFGELHRHTVNDQHQATIGAMVHELGHLIFGLPDLYDRDGSSSGIGVFWTDGCRWMGAK